MQADFLEDAKGKVYAKEQAAERPLTSAEGVAGDYMPGNFDEDYARSRGRLPKYDEAMSKRMEDSRNKLNPKGPAKAKSKANMQVWTSVICTFIFIFISEWITSSFIY